MEASLTQGSLYVPMIWGEGDLTEERLRDLAWVGDASPYLLGFNEPNYGEQVRVGKWRRGSGWAQGYGDARTTRVDVATKDPNNDDNASISRVLLHALPSICILRTVQIPTNHLSFDLSALWCLRCRTRTFRQISLLRKRLNCGLKFDNRRTIWAWSWCPQPSTSATGIVSKRYCTTQSHIGHRIPSVSWQLLRELGLREVLHTHTSSSSRKNRKRITPAQRG